jgi:hypothetical protein
LRGVTAVPREAGARGRHAVVALVCGLALAGCGDARDDPAPGVPTTGSKAVSKVPRSDGPNVFLIVVDAASAEFFGVYGDAHATSPTIDAFARESVVFENAYSQSATTTASSVSLLTGVRGTTHLMTGQSVLPEQFKTAAERFRAHGYQT